MKNGTSYIQAYHKQCGHAIAFAAIQTSDGLFGVGLCVENQPGVSPLPDYGSWTTLAKAAEYAETYNCDLELTEQRANDIVLSTWPKDS